MTYNCVILPEYFENNNFFNYKGGKEGCPIDRALFEAGDPLKGSTYAYNLSENHILVARQLQKQGVDNEVISIFTQVFEPKRIQFVITLPD